MSRGGRDEWGGGPYGGLGEAVGAFLWAVLFWGYFTFTTAQPTYPGNIAKEFPIFNLVTAGAVGVPLLLGWIMLLQGLGSAIVPTFTGSKDAQPVFPYLSPATLLLLIAFVIRTLILTIDRVSAAPQ